MDKGRIDRAIATQSDLIRASAVRMGYADPDILIKIRDEGLKRIREGVERQGFVGPLRHGYRKVRTHVPGEPALIPTWSGHLVSAQHE